MWHEIVNEDDINRLMDTFGEFHDGCIKELKYASNIFVREDLTICPADNERILKIIFQRQYENPTAIEMEFRELLQLRVLPTEEWYDSIIFGATMIKGDNCIYWCDGDSLSKSELDSYEGTLICASKVRWRVADEYIGEAEVYTAR